MNDLFFDWLNLWTLLFFLHWIIFENTKTAFLSTVKCWRALPCVKFFHVFNRYFLAHLLFFVVHEWVFVIVWVKAQSQNLMWWGVCIGVFGSSTFFHWKGFSLESAFSFGLILFQTFFFLISSAAHNTSGPSFIKILGTGIFFYGFLILNLNIENGRLLFKAIQVNIVHIKRVFSLKHLIHIFLYSGPYERFVHDVDDSGAVLRFGRKNGNNEVSKLLGVSRSYGRKRAFENFDRQSIVVLGFKRQP